MIYLLRLLRRQALWPLLVGSALACSGESPVAPVPMERLPRELSLAENSVIEASNAFAFSLFRELQRAEPERNLFVSPLSASMALGMTLNGAGGETFEEMRQTLRLAGLTLPEINASYRSLIDLLHGLDPGVAFQIANSVWYRQEFTVEQPFLDVVEASFDAEVQGLDFEDPSSRDIINRWVARSTADRIKEIVNEFEADQVMFLINAIYFKGSWTQRFDRGRTRDDLFRLIDGTRKPVKLMEQQGEFGYQVDDLFRAVDLPYGRGAFSMTLVLPNEGIDLETFVSGLDEASWARLVEGLSNEDVVVSLPRFRLEWEKTLNETLQALGMEAAFMGGIADFTGISRSEGGRLYIDKVKQKTFVEVNEEGTEAAAATSVGIKPISGPAEFRVDRPFFFAIRERFSGTLLFLGKIVDPPAN